MFQIALLGAGRIGQVHAANVAAHPRSTLHSVVDVNEAAARALAGRYGAVVRSADAVLGDEKIDAVLIATATDTHADLIERAARAGKKIFCEKPVDLSLERVKTCLATVRQTGATLLVGFNRRFDRHFRALKAAFDAGQVGAAESLLIISRDPAPPPAEYVRSSGGMLRDMTIHDIDLSRWLLGAEPTAVWASGSCLVDPAIGSAGDIDTATLTLEYPGGVLATVSNSRRTTYGYDQRVELHGAKGMLQAGNVTENTVVASGPGGVVGAKPQFFFLERYRNAYAAEWDHFVQVLQGEAEPSVTGGDGERSLAIADAALTAMQTGHKQPLRLDS